MTIMEIVELGLGLAGAGALISAAKEKLIKREAPQCASVRADYSSDRCGGRADPRCEAGNCTKHCNEYCKERCNP